jgi:hypothetical protein
MKLLFLAATLIFAASAKLQATEALMFYGGDYTLYILIGETDKGGSIADVRVTLPGAKDYLHVPREQLKIEKFDDKKQVLIMRFTNKNDPQAPPSFTFSAKKKKGVLTIDGKTYRSDFDWLDG